MNFKTPTTPHIPDHARLAVENALAAIIAEGMSLPADRVQVGYFAAAKSAIVTIPGIASRGLVGGVTRKASQVLSDAGYGIHCWDETLVATTSESTYAAHISVHVP